MISLYIQRIIFREKNMILNDNIKNDILCKGEVLWKEHAKKGALQLLEK